jgi:hypothetical protein
LRLASAPWTDEDRQFDDEEHDHHVVDDGVGREAGRELDDAPERERADQDRPCE